MAVEYTIICDRCASVVVASSESPAAARRDGKRDGVLFRVGRRDVCAFCRGND